MTTKIFRIEDKDFQLSCFMSFASYGRETDYDFKLMWRQHGKRKWLDIKGYERTYRVRTDMKDILKYIPKEDVLNLAKEEYGKYAPEERKLFGEIDKNEIT